MKQKTYNIYHIKAVKRSVNEAPKHATTLVFFAFILYFLAIFFPWWVITTKGTTTTSSGITLEGRSTADFKLQNVTLKWNVDIGLPAVNAPMFSESKQDGHDYMTDLGSDHPLTRAFNTLLAILLIALVALPIIMTILFGAWIKRKDVSTRTVSILLFIALIVTIAAPIYFMMALPPAINETAKTEDMANLTGIQSNDFSMSSLWGSTSTGAYYRGYDMQATASWGAGLAWYLHILACIVLIIAFIKSIFVLHNARAVERYEKRIPPFLMPNEAQDRHGSYSISNYRKRKLWLPKSR